MAFGFSPKYIKILSLDNLTTEHFLVIALEAAKRLDWNIGYTSEMGFVAFTKFSMSSVSEEVKVKIEGDKASLKSECVGSQMVDWGKNKENIEKFISTIKELRNAYTSDEFERKYEELRTTLVSGNDDILSLTPPTTKEKLTSVLGIFRPAKGYFITPLIINLNIVLFLLMIISGVNFFLPDGESLIRWGANFRPVTLNGEWYRLITNVFLHIVIFHLLMNMYALLYIGLLLEPHLGRTRFLSAYLLTGFTASVTSLWWHDITISAGASGAIFGMYGVFLALLTTNLIEKSARKALLTSIGIFVAYNLMNGMKGGIDNAAHIGGLIGGLVLGFSYYPSLVKPELKMRNMVLNLVTTGVVLIFSIAVILKIPNPFGQYDEIMKEFVNLEQKAMSFYRVPKNSTDDIYLKEIKEEGLPNWKACGNLAIQIDSLENLPEVLKSKSVLLKKYCDYRITSFNLMAQSIEKHTNVYNNQIGLYNQKIDLIIRKLKGEEIADSSLNVNRNSELAPNLPKAVLFVVDGRPVDDISKIKPEDIESTLFLEPKASFQLYGMRGQAGALIIQTKNK